MNYCEEKGISTSKLNEAQRTLYFIAENMKMTKSISEEGYEHFQQAIKALEEPCEDAVSRQALDKALYERFHDEDSTTKLEAEIACLPPVTPARKKGKWIKHHTKEGALSHIECSACHDWYVNCITSPYCPFCGAEMEVEE